MPAAVVNFEDENGENDDGALKDAISRCERVTWDDNDLLFVFNQMEIKMTSCGVKKNYTKFQVLAEISPKHIQDEVKHLLRKQATDFPNNDAYKILKHEILRIFGCKPEVTIQRALNRVLVGKPSTLARAIANASARGS